MSRSSRRLSFAAPLVLIAACHPKPPNTTHDNPPEPKLPAVERYAEWDVTMYGETCSADDHTPMECPEGASCNPPPPMAITCPEGIEEGTSMLVYQEAEGGPCFVDGLDDEEGNPMTIDCPSWGE